MAGTRASRGGAAGDAGTGPEEAYTAAPFVPERADLAALRAAAAGCRGCPLHRAAERTVFSSGDADARVVLVGEQPGDQEDRAGQPFVGPAGRVLMRALDEAGIDPTETYVTNAVKHFKFEVVPERGKRRIHKAPNLRELTACRPWLVAEIRLVEPEVIVALGATAGKALLGPSFRVTRQRGVPLPCPELDGEAPGAECVVATIHPSAVLRAADREATYRGLVSDLRVVAGALG
ncbi:UdgX family uracil-DNA binding protein [Streptomyces pactum]|uniref:Type-4 uracil-DNA glycosylase n=1 Tax=Streptomyces pactum TaxID=68249 RepID=A0ABS0NMC1_9ACTN|nr:UdgX family uracil-DNA binding protein [Streptomyces pactum]MBH5336338.1 UdgX family uracil-DNA binding protein [Streptomyces pactum]